MKNISIILLSVIIIMISSVLVQSCVSTKLAERGGTQLWGENCVRCHSTPPPNAFSSEQWETIDGICETAHCLLSRPIK